jgi:hypothetical protein
MKEKIDKMDFIKIFKICASKVNIKKVKMGWHCVPSGRVPALQV